MGLNQGDIFDSRDSTAETTVYKELLLSEKLLKELEYSNLKLKQAEEQLKIFEQVKYELRTEIAQLKAINEHNELTIEMNKILLNQQWSNFNFNELKAGFIYKQLEHYKNICKVSNEKIYDTSESLQNQRNQNDIRLQKYFYFSLTNFK